MTKVRMLMFDEHMKNITNENVKLGGDIVLKIDEIIDKQNAVKRRILIILFAVLAIVSDLTVIYLLKAGYNVPVRTDLLAVLCCCFSFVFIRLIDSITLLGRKRKKIREIEDEINTYLQSKGTLKTIRIMNSRFANYMLLATRFETYSLLIELKEKK